MPRKIDAVLITSTGSDEIKTQASSLGAGYMEKPLRLDELEKIIQQRANFRPRIGGEMSSIPAEQNGSERAQRVLGLAGLLRLLLPFVRNR